MNCRSILINYMNIMKLKTLDNYCLEKLVSWVYTIRFRPSVGSSSSLKISADHQSLTTKLFILIHFTSTAEIEGKTTKMMYEEYDLDIED